MIRNPTARRLLVSSLLLGLAAGLFVFTAVAATSTRDAPQANRDAVQEGGMLVIGAPDFDFIDPALALPRNPPFSVASWPVEDATCALLLRYPAGPPPAVSYRLVPEVAAAYRAVSRDGTTYTFTIRKGFRFSTGQPVTAANYANAINRDLNPAIRHAFASTRARGADDQPSSRTLDTPASPAAEYLREVVGAAAVQDGSARTASGVTVAGNRLIIRLTKRTPDFPARMTMPYFCPVPADLPIEPEGVSAPLPGSGPYYIAEFVRGSRVVLERNRYYRGTRPHHLDGMVVQVGDSSSTTTRKVETGEADIDLLVSIQGVAELGAKYGVNNKRYFSIPSPSVFYVVMNTSGPLFKNNVKLRQAVNFAIDRTALRDAVGPSTGSVTDDYLPTVMPGYVDAHVYPLDRPDVKKAQELARGNRRSGKAVMYVCEVGACLPQAQIIQTNLKQIGIDVTLTSVTNAAATAKIGTLGEPFDLFVERHTLLYADPSQLVNVMFDGRTIHPGPGNTDVSYFNSAHYNSLIEQAGQLSGRARNDAYGKLAVDLARNAAPVAAISVRNDRFFVSNRVGCVQAAARGGLDLAGLCVNK